MVFSNDFFKLFLFAVVAIFLAFVIISFSYFFSPSEPLAQKLSSYECGFEPYEDSRNVFDIRFYLVAILFIIFDLEAIYLFPWSISVSFLSFDGFWSMIDFILELLAGFFYAWEVKSLDWN
jgi:NADH-quinone oxidoreductase subunit A